MSLDKEKDRVNLSVSVPSHIYQAATKPLMHGQLSQLVNLFLANLADLNSKGMSEEYLKWLYRSETITLRSEKEIDY